MGVRLCESQSHNRVVINMEFVLFSSSPSQTCPSSYWRWRLRRTEAVPPTNKYDVFCLCGWSVCVFAYLLWLYTSPSTHTQYGYCGCAICSLLFAARKCINHAKSCKICGLFSLDAYLEKERRRDYIGIGLGTYKCVCNVCRCGQIVPYVRYAFCKNRRTQKRGQEQTENRGQR